MLLAYGKNTARSAAPAVIDHGIDLSREGLRRQRERKQAEYEIALARQEADQQERVLADLRLKLLAEEERVRQASAQIDKCNRSINYLYGARAPISIRTIVDRISRATGIPVVTIMSHQRGRPMAFARQAVFYWACRRTLHSLPEIGRRVGNRDHTTVLHGIRAYVEKRAAMGRHLRPARGKG